MNNTIIAEQVKSNSSITQKVNRLEAIKAQIAALEVTEKSLKNDLKRYVELPSSEYAKIEIVNADNQVIATVSNEATTRLDTQALRSDLPKVYAKYAQDSFRQIVRI